MVSSATPKTPMSEGHVYHGTRWPLRLANTGTDSTVNVEVSAPRAAVVPSMPMICSRYPTANRVPS